MPYTDAYPMCYAQKIFHWGTGTYHSRHLSFQFHSILIKFLVHCVATFTHFLVF